MNEPKISIIIPVYNSRQTLGECLHAIKSSTYKNYEIIVVNDGSTDSSIEIANKYADKVVNLSKRGRATARKRGIETAKGEIIVNIDSDVLINPNSLQAISEYFVKNKNVVAVTGMLDKNCPYKNFASQYKNLYIHYVFANQPKEVSFLYGSIYAFRKKYSSFFISETLVDIADDTEKGQKLIESGLKIHLIKDLQVTHLKEYSLKNLLINDFKIPYDWALIFWKFNGLTQLSESGGNFAHANKNQIISLLLMPIFWMAVLISIFMHLFTLAALSIFVLWFLINLRFFKFLFIERGALFSLKSVVLTFIDNSVMLAGVVAGTFSYFLNSSQ